MNPTPHPSSVHLAWLNRLEGIRRMDQAAVDRALLAFFADVRRIVETELAQVRAATGSKSAAEANSKFEGFPGSFATLRDFHTGAVASLKLGYPNPDTMKGIMLEHTQHPSVTRLFVTSNYRIATCLLIEYAWALMGNGWRGHTSWSGSWLLCAKELRQHPPMLPTRSSSFQAKWGTASQSRF